MSKLDIAVIVADQQRIHEGMVRPFVNLAKATRDKYTYHFLLLNCSTEFESFLKSRFAVVACGSHSQLVEEAKKLHPTCVLSDDKLWRVRLAQEVKKATSARVITYVQIFYGSHAFAGCFDLSQLTFKERLFYGSLKYLPFAFLQNRYSRQLGASDLVVANSRTTASFLHSVYGVGVDGVVYPPLDGDVFCPEGNSKENMLIVYLGSHLGDTNKVFVEQIVQAAKHAGVDVSLFGNPRLAQQITSTDAAGVRYHSWLSDVELAELYRHSKLTVCPQRWEQFGYVPVESIACGTPVLAFNCMGFQETITGGTGYLANNEAEFVQMLKEAVNSPQTQVPRHAVEPFSMKYCGESFERLLEKHFSALL